MQAQRPLYRGVFPVTWPTKNAPDRCSTIGCVSVVIAAIPCAAGIYIKVGGEGGIRSVAAWPYLIVRSRQLRLSRLGLRTCPRHVRLTARSNPTIRLSGVLANGGEGGIRSVAAWPYLIVRSRQLRLSRLGLRTCPRHVRLTARSNPTIRLSGVLANGGEGGIRSVAAWPYLIVRSRQLRLSRLGLRTCPRHVRLTARSNPTIRLSGVLANGGEGGIRTHVGLHPNGFQDRPVVTASVPLHKIGQTSPPAESAPLSYHMRESGIKPWDRLPPARPCTDAALPARRSSRLPAGNFPKSRRMYVLQQDPTR